MFWIFASIFLGALAWVSAIKALIAAQSDYDRFREVAGWYAVMVLSLMAVAICMIFLTRQWSGGVFP